MIVGVSGLLDMGRSRDRTDQVGSERIEAISSDCAAGAELDEEAGPELVLCISQTRFGRPSFGAAVARKSKELRPRRTPPSIL